MLKTSLSVMNFVQNQKHYQEMFFRGNQ